MLNDYQNQVTDFVRDDSSRITVEQRDAAIQAAALKYSAVRPRIVVADIADASGMIVALPAGWEDDFSQLQSIEYPVGRFPPAMLDDGAWAMYRDVDGFKIMLASSLPSGSTIRTTFTAPHLVSATVDTIPAADREAVAKYAAALLCDQLAAFYANDSDSTMGAVHAQGQTRSQAYAARARDYRKAYQDAIGVEDKTARPACAVGTMKPSDAYGQPFLFHPPRMMR